VPEARATEVGKRSERHWALRNGVHLWVLWGFAVVQPTVSVLGSAAARFFLLRAVEPVSLTVAIVGFAVAPPLLLLGLEAIAGRVSARARDGIHTCLVWILLSLVALYALKQLVPGGGWVTGAILVLGCWVLGLAGTAAYRRFSAPGLILDVLAPAPVLFVALLLFFSPVKLLLFPERAAAQQPATEARAPVVMVVFDEFPTTSLLTPDGEIDAARFPNFAGLVREATWFPNATTMSNATVEAVPSLLTGVAPRPEEPESTRVPSVSDHPNSLFTLLGRTHRLEVMELFTQLCTSDLCPLEGSVAGRTLTVMAAMSVASAHALVPSSVTSTLQGVGLRLPAAGSTWLESLNAQNPTREVDPSTLNRTDARRYPKEHLEKFIRSLDAQRPGQRPALYFLHVNLPHHSWKHTPSGQRYYVGPNNPAGRAPSGYQWTADRRALGSALQRHLLQVQLADRMVGDLVRRLKATGLYEKAAVVLVADHGGSFVPGGNHRLPRSYNLAEIAHVPLFFKAPGQRRGGIDRRYVRSVDILPTLADTLGVDIAWRIAGRSWLGPRRAGDRPLSITGYTGPMTPSILEEQRRRAVRRNIDLLGPGGGGPDLFAVGPHRELLGRSVGELDVADERGARVELDAADRLLSVDPRGVFIPALVEGRIVTANPRPQELAVAVDGRISAVGESSTEGDAFSIMVPPRAFRKGANAVEVFTVSASGAGPALHRLGGD